MASPAIYTHHIHTVLDRATNLVNLPEFAITQPPNIQQMSRERFQLLPDLIQTASEVFGVHRCFSVLLYQAL